MTDVYAPQSSSDTRKFVKSFASDGTAEFDQVNFEDLDFTRIFGQITTSNTQNAIAYGVKAFTLDYDNNSIQVGYPLQCRSLDDPDCFMQGVVVKKDQTYSPAYIEVAITIISPLVNTTNNWELSVIPLAGFSINPSATVGISTTSINASGAGPFTFSTQTGKLFMQTGGIGGTVICAALADPKTYLFGRIKANNSTSLVVEKIYSNATAAVAAWSIQMFDGPDNVVPFTSMSGLNVSVNSSDAFSIDVQPGTVMDSTGTIPLTLDSALTKSTEALFAAGTAQGGALRSAALPGTVSSAGTAVTGTGTAFLTDFEPRIILNDFDNSYPTYPGGGNRRFLISTDTTTAEVSGEAASNTSLTTITALGASGSVYYRGGPVNNPSNAGDYFVVIMRRDSDGLVDIGLQCTTPSGEPDLPSGFTHYRCIAFIRVSAATGVANGVLLPIIKGWSPNAALNEPFLTYTTSTSLNDYEVLTSSASITVGPSGTGTFLVKRAALTDDVTATVNDNATTIAANVVTNTKLNDMAAYTLKGRNAGTTGDPSDIDISALTEKTSLADDDLFIIQDSAASNAFKKAKKSNVGSVTTFPQDFGLITEAATLIFDSGTVP